MKKYQLLILSLMSLLFWKNSHAQGGYKINFEITNATDTDIFLGYHLGDLQYIKDTITTGNPGSYTAKGDVELDPGMYFVYFASTGQTFDLLINKGEQHFTLKTDYSDLVSSMLIEGSPENTRFFDYLHFLNKKRNERTKISESLEKLDKNEANSIQQLEAEIQELDESVVQYQDNLIKNHPTSFTARLIQVNTPVSIPEAIGSDDAKRFYYYKEHFFDNTHLDDERFVRTPFLLQKIDSYVSDKLTVRHPDSLIVAVDRVISLSKGNNKVLKFVLTTLLNKYATTKIVCLDAVYVHLIDTYYTTGMADWIEKENLQKILKNADELRPVLCGKVAPDIVLQTINPPVQTKRLHDVDSKYTVLFFWSPDAANIKESIYELAKFHYEFKSKGVKIVSVCTANNKKQEELTQFLYENNMNNWLNLMDKNGESRFIKDYALKYLNSIYIYVLDENKEIISKRIGPEQLTELLNNLEE